MLSAITQLKVMADSDNPDRCALAAHAMRELNALGG